MHFIQCPDMSPGPIALRRAASSPSRWFHVRDVCETGCSAKRWEQGTTGRWLNACVCDAFEILGKTPNRTKRLQLHEMKQAYWKVKLCMLFKISYIAKHSNIPLHQSSSSPSIYVLCVVRENAVTTQVSCGWHDNSPSIIMSAVATQSKPAFSVVCIYAVPLGLLLCQEH